MAPAGLRADSLRGGELNEGHPDDLAGLDLDLMEKHLDYEV